jgi:PAS domain-containing protein
MSMGQALLIQSAGARAASVDGHVGAADRGEEDALALTLDNRGIIRDCSGPSVKLFNYRHDELIQRHISLLLPELEKLELVRNGEANHRLRYQCRIGRHFMAVTRHGEHYASKLFLNILDSSGDGRLTLIIRPAETTSHGGAHTRRHGNALAAQSTQVTSPT